jgi:CIC family chloride channel protein
MRQRTENTSKKFFNDYFKIIGFSVLIGLVVGLSVVGFFYIYSTFRTSSIIVTSFFRYSVLVLPALGFTLSYLIVKTFSYTKTTGCGSHVVLGAYHYEGSIISPKDTVIKPFASAITIGLGGSAGLEGPSLLLGGGLGSAIGQRLKSKHEDLRTFLLSGAAAGISAIFKAPLTGILFALELPYQRDLAREAFISATISSLTAYFISISFLGAETLFPLIPVVAIPSAWMILNAFIIGLMAAVCGIIFVKVFEVLNRFMLRFTGNYFACCLVGGLIVGLIGLYIPQVLGVGYETIEFMVNGEFLNTSLIFLAALMVFKIIATSITLNSGGSGGFFIPSIFVGAVLGAIYVRLVPYAPIEVLVMASMAAIIAAVNKTLLTSVAFVAETAGPSSIILTLVSATTSYFASGSFSFYREVQPSHKVTKKEEAVQMLLHKIKKRNDGSDFAVKVGEIMTPNPFALNDSMSIKAALDAIKKHDFRVYPIVNHENALLGYITVEDLLRIPETKQFLSLDAAPIRSPIKITAEDRLEGVIDRIVEQNIDHIYVVSDVHTMKLVGVIAEIDVLKKLLERV